MPILNLINELISKMLIEECEMGFWSSITNLTHQDILSRYSDKTQEIARKLEIHYETEADNFTYHLGFARIGENVLEDIQDFISAINKDLEPSDEKIFDSIVHAYITKNTQYPEKFDSYIAMQYLNKTMRNNDDSFHKNRDQKNTEWFKQKVEQVDKHLERISLVKLQLTKNLKELESQGEGHLWIDHEFIDPALDTLKGSLAQVQDIENRMLVLKATYQDHQR